VPDHDLICGDCQTTFSLTTHDGLTVARRRCPHCGSIAVRETFESCFRNRVEGRPEALERLEYCG
jgi:hypothetical protein